MSVERSRDIAHVSAVQLRTQVPEQTVDFFVRLLGLSELAREDGSATCAPGTTTSASLSVVEAGQPGIGSTWLRAAGPEALARRVTAIEASGLRNRAGPTARTASARPICSATRRP